MFNLKIILNRYFLNPASQGITLTLMSDAVVVNPLPAIVIVSPVLPVLGVTLLIVGVKVVS